MRRAAIFSSIVAWRFQYGPFFSLVLIKVGSCLPLLHQHSKFGEKKEGVIYWREVSWLGKQSKQSYVGCCGLSEMLEFSNFLLFSPLVPPFISLGFYHSSNAFWACQHHAIIHYKRGIFSNTSTLYIMSTEKWSFILYLMFCINVGNVSCRSWSTLT